MAGMMCGECVCGRERICMAGMVCGECVCGRSIAWKE